MLGNSKAILLILTLKSMKGSKIKFILTLFDNIGVLLKNIFRLTTGSQCLLCIEPMLLNIDYGPGTLWHPECLGEQKKHTSLLPWNLMF